MRHRSIEGRSEDLARWASHESDFPVTFLDGNDGTPASRFSFLATRPVDRRLAREDAPFALFDELDASRSADRDPDRELAPGLRIAELPRWIGAIAYDLAWSATRELGLRRGPVLHRAPSTLAFFDRFEALVVADRARDALFVVGESELAVERLLEDVRALRDAAPAHARLGPIEAEPRDTHARAIEAALGSIADGDVYQINLARRWRAPLTGSLHPGRALASAMRSASPVPFGAYLEAPGLALVARTMERFLRWDRRSGLLETRPIKGTIARASDRADDTGEDALLGDAKERAEHAMIVDLMRNDLGRIAQTGSVVVERAFEVEPYARLSHLVSTVRATCREDATLRAVLEASFPPGSVTGTPKLRAIELIEALERFPRGFYTGAIGHVDRAGGVSLAVAIRTAQLEQGHATYFAGGGIVDASIVEREVDETELKAKVFLDAAAALARRA